MDGKKPLKRASPSRSSSSDMPISPVSARPRSMRATAIFMASLFHRSISCRSTTWHGVGGAPAFRSLMVARTMIRSYVPMSRARMGIDLEMSPAMLEMVSSRETPPPVDAARGCSEMRSTHMLLALSE